MQLIAALADLLRSVQKAVHRANRAEIAVFVEQCGVDFGGSLIDEPFRVQGVENGPPLLSREGSWRRGPQLLLAGTIRHLAMTVERGPRDADRRAGRGRADFAG